MGVILRAVILRAVDSMEVQLESKLSTIAPEFRNHGWLAVRWLAVRCLAVRCLAVRCLALPK